MKKINTIIVALIMVISLVACSESNENGNNDNSSNTPNNSVHNSDNTSDVVELNVDVAAAMKAGDNLTGSYYLLAKDGSVITIGDSSEENFAEIYSTMQNVRKLSLTNVGTAVVALTDSGELYYQNNKIGENVIDVAYCTTNTNVEAFCLVGNDVMWITSDDVLFESPRSSDFKHIITKEAVRGNLLNIKVDKHDFTVVNEKGETFIYYGGSSDAYSALDFSEFEKMAFVDIAKVMQEGEVKSLTVAGLRRDGTTVAVGTYAQDILNWGKLSYLTMSDGMIVGLTADGKLKMTGEYAQQMGDIVEGWSNIVAVEAGYANVNNMGSIITAVDSAGDFYYVSLTDTLSSTDNGRISVANGAAGDRTCWKYTPDGKVFCSTDGAWELTTDE